MKSLLVLSLLLSFAVTAGVYENGASDSEGVLTDMNQETAYLTASSGAVAAEAGRMPASVEDEVQAADDSSYFTGSSSK